MIVDWPFLKNIVKLKVYRTLLNFTELYLSASQIRQ